MASRADELWDERRVRDFSTRLRAATSARRWPALRAIVPADIDALVRQRTKTPSAVRASGQPDKTDAAMPSALRALAGVMKGK